MCRWCVNDEARVESPGNLGLCGWPVLAELRVRVARFPHGFRAAAQVMLAWQWPVRKEIEVHVPLNDAYRNEQRQGESFLI